MRSMTLAGLLFSVLIASALAQQGSISIGESPAAGTTAGGTAQNVKPPALKPSRLACAAICTKAVTETTLSDEDQKWFAQCAGALLCQGKPSLPLASQPKKDDGINDAGIGSYLRKMYRDIIG